MANRTREVNLAAIIPLHDERRIGTHSCFAEAPAVPILNTTSVSNHETNRAHALGQRRERFNFGCVAQGSFCSRTILTPQSSYQRDVPIILRPSGCLVCCVAIGRRLQAVGTGLGERSRPGRGPRNLAGGKASQPRAAAPGTARTQSRTPAGVPEPHAPNAPAPLPGCNSSGDRPPGATASQPCPRLSSEAPPGRWCEVARSSLNPQTGFRCWRAGLGRIRTTLSCRSRGWRGSARPSPVPSRSGGVGRG